MRGFWPEEKIEGGSWNLGNPLFRLVNRYFKRLESRLLAESDAIISLTDAGKAELLKRTELRRESDRVTVVPCCVDIDHFELAAPVVRQSIRGELGIAEEAAVLAYLGSLGGNYLLGEMLDFFRTYSRRHPGARFLFITREDAGAIRAEADRHGIRNEELVIRPARREEVPRLLAAADLGIAFKQPSFSALGCSPTKMGEMMAVGLPIIANAGVGDVAEILARTRAGVTVSHFDEAAYARALDELDRGHAREQRRQTAVACFDIALGVERYDRIYRHLSATVGKRQAHR
jgi:glycosyltransferase involved in cell wall biosynthesis